MDSPNKPHHACCPVCRHAVLKDKYAINDFSIVQCRACGLVFVKERLSRAELDAYYTKGEGSLNVDDDAVYVAKDNVSNLNYYLEKLRSLILERIPAGRLLDVGCNAGHFLDVMKDFECHGIERSVSHAKMAQEKHGKNIFIGTFEDYQAPDGFFDCITLLDVLDHMTDPLAVLKKCHRLLRSRGLLVIKVHDISSLYAQMTGKNFYAYLPPVHLFYFRRSSLKTVLEGASFDLVFSRHLGHEMFLSTVFFRLSKWNQRGLFFKMYKALNGTWLGRRKIRKNLHDIITVLAVKKD